MRIPLTKYGLPQVALFPAFIIAAMIAMAFTIYFLPLWAIITMELVLLTVLIWVLSFFRDPIRQIPTDPSLLLSGADGKITDITEVDCPQIGAKAIRVGVFLSIFNVHINRVPCNCTVEKINYIPGSFKDARDPAAGSDNEANELVLKRTDLPLEKLLLRQISGAVARRIVCRTKPGDHLKAGQQFGMIKFGSRTEIYIPKNDKLIIKVKLGQRVKAGTTILAEYVK